MPDKNYEKVEVRSSAIDANGKGLFAKTDIPPGECIWTAKRPLVAALDRKFLSTACSNCFRVVGDVTWSWLSEDGEGDGYAVKACAQCKLLRFCSKTCQLETWRRHHAVECKFFARKQENAHSPVTSSLDSCTCRLLTQLLVMRKKGSIDDKQWQDILSLQAQQPNAAEGSKIDELHVKVALTAVNDATAFEAATVPKLLRILRLNSFAIVTPTFDSLGVAFDPLISRINHDCDPNCSIVYDGARISLRNFKAIDKDTEVTMNYVDATAPFKERQEELRDGWSFVCSCPTCTSGATTWRDPSSLECGTSKQSQQGAINQVKSLNALSKDDITAISTRATQFRDEYRKLPKASFDQRLRLLEDAEKYLKATTMWPVYLQPRAMIQHELMLLYIQAGRYLDATKLAASITVLVDPVQFPKFHPLRVIHGIRLLQLLNNLETEVAAVISFDLCFFIFEFACRAIAGAQQIHGRGSRFHQAICNRFGEASTQFTRETQLMSKPKIQVRVQIAIDGLKAWATGDEDVRLAERALTEQSIRS